MNISSAFDLHGLLHQEDREFLQLLQNAGLVRHSFRCPNRNCRQMCTLQSRQAAALGYVFRCSRCRTFHSILKGSFFENQRLTVRQILYIMFLWACEARLGTVVNITAISKKSIVQEFRFIRDICSWKLLQDNEPFLLGKFLLCKKYNLIIMKLFQLYRRPGGCRSGGRISNY